MEGFSEEIFVLTKYSPTVRLVFGVTILGQNPLTFMIAIYGATILCDYCCTV